MTYAILPHTHFMQHALSLAKKAQAQGEIPVGAILVLNHEIIGESYNQAITLHDPTAHAEILALRDAGQKIQNYRFMDATLYVTLEPCNMCVGALIHARVKNLVFGALDPKTGSVATHLHLLEQTMFNHKIAWEGGCLAKECGQLLTDFFRDK